MRFEETPLAGAYVIELDRHGDERGFFARVFCDEEFGQLGLSTHYVQVNDSLSATRGTLRGMHYQLEPHTETKLVRCIKGSLCDVILDIRPGSQTFGQHFKIELSAENRRMLYVPKGFAHAFQTLEDDTEALYLVDSAYAPQAERGVRWDDPELQIDWPMSPTVMSEKDRSWPDFDPDGLWSS